MSDFQIWFEIGAGHILDLAGYDHILYVTLLSLTYPLTEWKKLLILITGFTVGHSLSLGLSVINNWPVPQPGIELLIALSILVTACYQLNSSGGFAAPGDQGIPVTKRNSNFYYMTALIFGLVHGFGFSFLLRAMLGSADKVILPLLYFNLGLECGQLIIVGVILLFSLILRLFVKGAFPVFKTTTICLIAIISLVLCVQRVLQLF